jgi:phospholipid/cholesterol/gamma-HCH transport system permease protein
MVNTQNIFESLGQKSISFFTSVHEICALSVNTFKSLPSIWFYRRQIIEQLYAFSVKTLPIAAVISVFLGLGAMVQGVYQSTPLIPRAYTINVIFKSTVIELCPVILSLVLAGKLGASLAAEIGSMKISEQIESLEMMSLDPVGFLVMPRFLAGLVMLPIMTILANIIALFSVFFVSTIISDWISPQEFLRGMQMDFRAFELYLGNLIKPSVYGSSIALIGSYFGLKAVGGAKGVGEASTNGVVVSAILIVVLDYYIGKLFL